MGEIQTSVSGGIDSVFTYGNIAVTVLFLCLIGSALMNLIMYRDARKDRRDVTDALLSVKESFGIVQITLALINQRLEHHD